MLKHRGRPDRGAADHRVACRPRSSAAARSRACSARGVRDVHRAVFDRDQDTVTLTRRRRGTVLAAALERCGPALAREVEATGARRAAAPRPREPQRRARARSPTTCACSRSCSAAGARARRAGALALVAATAGATVRRARRRARPRAACSSSSPTRSCARSRSAASSGPEDRAAAGAVWDAFLGDLRTAAWILAGAGAVVAAAAASLIRPVDLGEPLRRARRAGVDASRAGRRCGSLRGAALVAAGVMLLVARDAVLALLVHARRRLPDLRGRERRSCGSSTGRRRRSGAAPARAGARRAAAAARAPVASRRC